MKRKANSRLKPPPSPAEESDWSSDNEPCEPKREEEEPFSLYALLQVDRKASKDEIVFIYLPRKSSIESSSFSIILTRTKKTRMPTKSFKSWSKHTTFSLMMKRDNNMMKPEALENNSIKPLFKVLMNTTGKCSNLFQRRTLKTLKNNINMGKWRKKISFSTTKLMKETWRPFFSVFH